MLRHRTAEKRDYEVICSLPQNEEELFYFFPRAIYPLTPEQLQQAVEHRADSTVVEQDGVVVGFANFYRWEGGICCIGNVVVAPRARGQGVARYLVQTMVGLAQSKHQAAEIRVACFNHNTAGLLVYPKLGFSPFAVEERRTLDGAPVALIHMRYREQSKEAVEPTR